MTRLSGFRMHRGSYLQSNTRPKYNIASINLISVTSTLCTILHGPDTQLLGGILQPAFNSLEQVRYGYLADSLLDQPLAKTFAKRLSIFAAPGPALEFRQLRNLMLKYLATCRIN